MLISLNWLKDFVDIPESVSPEKLGSLLTLKTAEVEEVVSQADFFKNMVTGHVLSVEKHPDADKLQVASVDIGEAEPVQIVCGGANLKADMDVAVTKVGAKVFWHGEDEAILIKKAKVRGVESHGMIAAAVELGLNDPKAGPKDIMDLSALSPKAGTPLSEIFKKDDFVFEFDNKSLTHRPDLWGHKGIAREVAVVSGGKFKEPEINVEMPSDGEKLNVEIKDKELCYRYCGLIIENIKVEESPEWLKNRLKAVGHGTHNNIVDITNYVMAEIGQPMHAFDYKNIKGGIVVRRAKSNEKIKTLDGEEHDLSEEMLMIADHEKSVAVAGVMGGEFSGINENTNKIILESANFNAASVRRTSTKLGLRTDAVQRFEKSIDPLWSEMAIRRAAELILQVCPNAKISGPMIDAGDYEHKDLKVSFDADRLRKKIGIDIENDKIKEILESLAFVINSIEKNIFNIVVPSFRATKDVSIEADLVEEIARIYGYDNIPATLPVLPLQLSEENVERSYKHRARTLFSYGLGMDEVYNYSFYGHDDLEKCLMNEDAHIHLENYLSSDQTHMRISLVPNLLKNLADNSRHFDDVSIYEIGHTYKEIGSFMPLEEKKILGAFMVKKKSDDSGFYLAKGAVESFFKEFNVSVPNSVNDIKDSPYAHPSKAVSYVDYKGQTVARVFALHPIVSKNYDLDAYSIAFFEINLTEFMKLKSKEKKYKKISKFPSIQIDVSVVIDRNIEIGKIDKSIRDASRKLISKTELFDIYEGYNIADDKKAVAFKITLQASDRTLTDTEMSDVQKVVFENLKKLGGEIRGA